MTPYRSWTALGALLLALAGSMAWAKGCFNGCGPAQAAGCCDKGKCCEAKCGEAQAVGAAEESDCPCCREKKKTARTANPQVIYVPVPMPWMPSPYFEAGLPMLAPPAPPYAASCVDPVFTPNMVPPPAPSQPCPVSPVVPPASVTAVPPAPACPQVCQNVPSVAVTSRAVEITPPVCQDQARTIASTTVVRAVGGQLDLQTGDVRATCQNMVLKGGEGKTLKLAVADRHVQVSCDFFEATAERMTQNKADATIILEGQVHLKYHKGATSGEIKCEHVVLGLNDGRMELRSAGPIPTGCKPTDSPKPTSDSQQLFQFWTGILQDR